ncbi:hypothetical protein [Williamwhitmania taraxaci]|uniref:Uncharacterized protein n=1 Tax=Williamwhitmania taraxaci TaxID=1640674 RepID=A0A1G6JL67_9BACT|nr:hypothetical protein [Williamwhitmania taraxaci]SDC18696.1 hypothetical protein SAMN05216323_102034 [Williamwhitmania taraxaci]
MITLFVIGDRNNVEWVKAYAAQSGFDCFFIASIADLPSTYVSQGAVFIDTIQETSFVDLSNLVRRGFHLYLNSPFDLSQSELSHLSLLAEEAGVFVIPRLPMELKLPSEIGCSPLVGNIFLEIADIPDGDAWRNYCLEVISCALSAVPFSVKRVRYVSSGHQSNSSVFMGFHLEFENTSLISISIGTNTSRNSLDFQFIGSFGSYKFGSTEQSFVVKNTQSREQQLSHLVDLCSAPTRRYSVVELDTISQVIRIYSEMKVHLALA